MTMITRRRLLQSGAAIGALSVIGPRSGVAQALPPHEQALYEVAKKEGEITWYSGQLNAETGEAVGKAFAERYPGLKANVIRSTSQVAFQRLSQDARAGVFQCDIFSSTNSGHYGTLKGQKALAKFRPKNADGLIAAAKTGDPDDFWQIIYFGLYLMAYNTKLVKDEDAPKSWTDILNPKWKNQLAVGHPGFSGAIGVWGVQMRKDHGADYFKKLEANKPQIGRSSQDPITLLNSGERTIGVAVPSATTLQSINRGNPLKLIYPTDGTVATPAPTAIMEKAPHPNAARLFMEFACGPAYSHVIRQFYTESIRPDVPPPEGSRPLDEIKLVAPSLQEQEKGVPEILELWRDVFGV